MSKFDASDKEKLHGLLKQRLELFEKICDQCQEQTGLLSEDKLEQLEKSLDKTHKLREKIDGLHQETEELVQSYASCPEDMKDKAIEEMVDKTKAAIERCAKLNAQNMDAIKALTETQKKKIDEQRAKREGIGGYAQQVVTTSSELIDKKS